MTSQSSICIFLITSILKLSSSIYLLCSFCFFLCKELICKGHYLFLCKEIYLLSYFYVKVLIYSEKARQPTPVLLPGKSHGRRSLVGCSRWGRWGSDMTEWLHFHFPFSCIGEGNGNPLQCSCLENPRDGGAWWAAVSGVAQNWTRLKWLSSTNILFGK